MHLCCVDSQVEVGRCCRLLGFFSPLLLGRVVDVLNRLAKSTGRNVPPSSPLLENNILILAAE